ncbi:hypothetical protein [Terracoccus sp. 273MFTsu3.1]|uniref:hypothetical protein n=1 Tax=Terracoccus sp. 273MFTsu3.1 TaxID=1172188 RepID=UPI0003A2056A|nr:hypothetical protein [Terracoccus sp. 273MFTsu3.1]
MNDLSPMSDVIADDLLLDRLAGRLDAGSEPVAALLGALSAHADTPLPSRTGRRRIANKHRYLGAFAALAVAASGAGVAAAVTLPANGPSQADRARIVEKMDESARSGSPSALLARLGLPQTSGTTEARGLVLARAEDGTIVLLPAAVVAAQGRAAAAGANGMPGAAAGAEGGRPVANGLTGGQNGQAGNGQVGNGQVGNGQVGNGQGGNPQGGAAAGGGQTGTPQATNNGKKPAPGTKGGKKSTVTPTATPTPTPTGTSEVVVPPATFATSTPTAPASRTRTPGPVRPRPTGGAGGSTGSGSSGTSGTSGGTTDGTGGPSEASGGTSSTDGTSGTSGLTDTLSGSLDGAASTAAGVVGAVTGPVVPTL